MKAIDPDLFTKLMTLPQGKRMDLLEFLGATPVGNAQLNRLIEDIESSLTKKQNRGHSDKN
ncbi:hypothetical protein [Cochlodiniinecator piscidefendens]|uniref:hypothetical protein n=1 Tax=Cochlodiniinecator piscidefendens TaxID=2715756 RepID=UPI001409C98D|nr:hypothetical protein [Cochlodiniinecator piscidefendens]